MAWAFLLKFSPLIKHKFMMIWCKNFDNCSMGSITTAHLVKTFNASSNHICWDLVTLWKEFEILLKKVFWKFLNKSTVQVKWFMSSSRKYKSVGIKAKKIELLPMSVLGLGKPLKFCEHCWTTDLYPLELQGHTVTFWEALFNYWYYL